MPWDQDTVKRHEAWFDSPVGRFALARELHLVDTVIADWPRRNQRLVEIGCGLGIFLEEFWRGGLDITGLDNSPAMIAACRERLGHRAELFLGNADHLPFEDKEFDYAALVTLLEFCPDPGAVLREATRTAKKGLVLRSRYGSGKTTFMQRLIKERDPKRVLFITYRQTLARDIMRNFGKLGFKNYLDSNKDPGVW